MIRRGVPWVITAIAVAACGDSSPAEPEDISPAAAAYLTSALDIMEQHSLKRYEIDWPAFRPVAFDLAGAAQSPADTYAAIEDALERLGDNHSFFVRPAAPSPANAPALHPGHVPSSRLVAPGVGYVDVPPWSGDGDDATQLADFYHGLIEQVDTLGACRWVVDLRGNLGGNMWPMLAGLGPILGEGLAGHFVDADSVAAPWSYEAGAAKLDGSMITEVGSAYALVHGAPPVAIMTDALTASSGEAIAIAFRGRADARSFGGSTFGVSTANASYYLSDGAMIALATAWMADRTGDIYGEKVDPDALVVGPKTADRSTDLPLDSALTWLETYPCT